MEIIQHTTCKALAERADVAFSVRVSLTIRFTSGYIGLALYAKPGQTARAYAIIIRFLHQARGRIVGHMGLVPF